MIEHSNQTFESLFNRGDALKIEDMRFVACEFVWSGLSLTTDQSRRSTVRNVELINCRFDGCEVGPAILEEINVATLHTNDLLILWGPLFRHVKLSGPIGPMKINQQVTGVDLTESIQKPFDVFRERYYASVDWALDISEARFKEFDFRGIPAHLVRRDPESQVVITRERALDPSWRKHVSNPDSLWPFMIDLFLSDGDQDTVFVAPLGAPKKKRDESLRGLRELREIGVAEPD